MKKIIFTLVYLFCVFAANAQNTELSETEKNNIIQSISQEAKKQNTISCDFKQEKISTLVSEKAVSTGKMYFQKTHNLRWEYTTPTKTTLIVNNENIVLKNELGQTVNSNPRMLKELTNIIIGTIDGSGLNDNKNFTSEMTINNNTINIKLTPINKRLANFYSFILLNVDKETKLANSITMKETNGDSTTIYFSNHKINQQLDSKLFNVE